MQVPELSKLEWMVLGVGTFLALTRLYGLANPAEYRRLVDKVLAMPEGLLQVIGAAAFLAGAVFWVEVFSIVPALPLAGLAVGGFLMAGGLLWLLPNVMRDLSHALFFNRSLWWVRLVCFLGASAGAGLAWVVLRDHLPKP